MLTLDRLCASPSTNLMVLTDVIMVTIINCIVFLLLHIQLQTPRRKSA